MSKIEPKQKRKGSKLQIKPMILIALVVFSIILHASYIITGFGETDAARLAVLAAEWHQTGMIHDSSYALRTSPLYIHFIKATLDLGVPLHDIPQLMNWLNVILGSLTLIPLYFLWRLFSKPAVSALACLFFWITPAFWLANIYGMAHLPAFSLFITSLWLFSRSVTGTHRNEIAWMVASTVLAILSVFLKADIILCFGAYLGITICMHPACKRSVIYSLVMPVIALLTVILYSHMISPSLPALGGSVGAWSTSFPFTIEAISDRYNRMIPVRATGILLFAACVLSTTYCIIRRRHMRLVVFCLLWACPLILFWGLKMGNSARHMMAAFCPLLFLSAFVGHDLIKNSRTLWPSVAAILMLNYLVGSGEMAGTTSPIPQLHRLHAIVNDYAGKRHSFAKSVAELKGVPQLIYAGNATISYVEWESFILSQSFSVFKIEPRIYRLVKSGDCPQLLGIHHVTSPDTVQSSDEWLVFSFEPGIAMRPHPKWMKYLADQKFKLRAPNQ